MELPRRPWLAVLAGLAAAGAVTAQAQALAPAPVDPVTGAIDAPDAAPAAGAPASAAPASAAPGTDWRVPPVALSGWVSYDLRASRAAGETNTLSQLLTTHVSAGSYIYQPWFATVSGTLGMTVGRSRGGGDLSGSEGPFAAADNSASKDRFLTGSARIDVFPRSRFPFEAHFERTDSRVDNALMSSLAFQTQNIGFSQRYRPASGAYNVSGGFERREQVSAGIKDTQDLLTGDFGMRWKHNDLTVGLTQSQARRPVSDEQSTFRSLVARHQYLPEQALSLNTTVNWSQTQEQLPFSASDVSVLQLSSVGLWQPAGSKLALSASARGILLRDALTDHGVDSVGLTLGASYELNRNARFTANGTATTTNSDGTRSQGFSGAVAASWQGDTIEFGGLRYDWFASGSAGASTASTSGGAASLGLIPPRETQTTLSTQLGHTLSRSWPITAQSTLMLNGGQSLTLTQNRSNLTQPGDLPMSTRVLLQTAAATWNIHGDNRSAYARVSYNDSRELGGTHAQFQLLNFQLSGNFEFDRNRSLSGDLTMQRVMQRSGDSFQTLDRGGLAPGERNSSNSLSGEIIYRHQRLFGIPRLRFTSRLKLAQDVLRQPGTLNSIPDRETRLWENRLDWLVGRLETQVVLRISQIEGKRREFLMFRVQRSFGG